MALRFQVGDTCYDGIGPAAAAHLATVPARTTIYDFGDGPEAAVISPAGANTDEATPGDTWVPVQYVVETTGKQAWIEVTYFGQDCVRDEVTAQHTTDMADMWLLFFGAAIVIACVKGLQRVFDSAPHHD